MKKRGLFFQVVLPLCIATCAADGKTKSRVGVGLAYTNNVYQMAESPESDFYTELMASTNFQSDAAFQAGVSATYVKYFRKLENNVFIWSLSAGKKYQNWESDFRLRGQSYTDGSPGLNDESFDFIGLVASFFREYPVRNLHTFTFIPSYEFRNYTGLKRNDHIFKLSGILDWQLASDKLISPSLETEWVLSNDPSYSRNSLLVRMDFVWKNSPEVKSKFFAAIKSTQYPNRTVSQEIIVYRNRGKFGATTLDLKERVNYLSLGAAADRILDVGEIRGSLQMDSQSSRSGYLDYSELITNITYSYKF